MSGDYIDVSGEGVYEHKVGDVGCCESWCGPGVVDFYPKKCSCGGLIHADFGDDYDDGDYWLYTKCDKCGERE